MISIKSIYGKVIMMSSQNYKKNVFIIGSKGIPAQYGGFESFLEHLTFYKKSNELQYHISCLGNEYREFKCNKARCFSLKVPNIGSARAVLYDVMALKYCLNYIKENKIQRPIIYILACRIGPFIKFFKKKLKKLGGILYINPDGNEWKRNKWNWLIKKYWKLSEMLMIKHAELLICDSYSIQKYIINDYKKYSPKTKYISYGAEICKSILSDEDIKVISWFHDKKVNPNEYYLIVGRFVPENNYEIMISEFMKSKTKKDLVIITNAENNRFYRKLMAKTRFKEDTRIKFAGTVYDNELLKKIRENAFGYLHGHEVGGTNPSLLEALGSTNINMLIDINFNKEVGRDGAIYWNKKNGNLSGLLDKAESLSIVNIDNYGYKAKKIIFDHYSWDKIVKEYEDLFLADKM